MKTMLMTAMLIMGTVGVQAATYTWDGSAADGNWNNFTNWTVVGSADGYLWPNQQYGSEYVNHDCTQITISNGDAVSRYSLSVDGERDGSTTSILTLSGGSTLNLSLLWIADYGNTKGEVNLINSILNITGSLLDVGNDGQGVLNAESSTITVNNELRVGPNGSTVGHITLTNSTLTTGNIISVGVENGSRGYFTLNGDSTVNTSGYHLRIAKKAGAMGEVTIADNADVDVNGIYMCDDSGTGAIAKLTVNGGKLTTHYNVYVADDGSGEAYFTVNGGEVEINGLIDVPWSTTGSKGHFTINGGLVVVTGPVNFGISGDDSGQGRLFMNDGVLICSDLGFKDTNANKVKDTGEFDGIVVFTGGQVFVKQSNMSEADMNAYISGGWIDISGADAYITTIDVDGTAYTALASKIGTVLIIN